MDKNSNNSATENTKNSGISEALQEETLRELCHLLKNADDEDEVYNFFTCLFTPPELKDMASRWILVKEIDAGTTQREIARKYSMSLCKITRGSRELHKAESAFRKMLEKLKKI